MRATKLPYELEQMIRRDLHRVHKHIEEILLATKLNYRVIRPKYLAPDLDKEELEEMTSDKGALHHYRRVRSVLEYIFEHDGMIREKYRPMLHKIEAPPYLISLLQVTMDRARE